MKIKWGARWKGYVYPPRQKPYIIESEIRMLFGMVSWLVKALRSWVEMWVSIDEPVDTVERTGSIQKVLTIRKWILKRRVFFMRSFVFLFLSAIVNKKMLNWIRRTKNRICGVNIATMVVHNNAFFLILFCQAKNHRSFLLQAVRKQMLIVNGGVRLRTGSR
jgi:hypothetical protein